ncbi:MAG: heat-shock protein Hsp20 [Sulfurimonas sp. RIFOXYD12_FULL_33_39]|uniref:Hsp20/alpha crystallin family protein n=1 Tax=unclassified Sulfurimonas TaxID=2623549 RepID=UPI0008C8B363|nr:MULTISPECIES: Hsp20/alpha crystallin family protein [unclassified Sulfurimonas]OHE05920.1 MAG: heat-shock protein Hsp20 [Sulfurimonas sp. RIFCSPLOWO2_12_FULL_34_6]OHE09287.1 MAG: heat-shock protein Hsp20 [Sulfurimonas sp. RIFOXYD12_FULL_33_39]OHE12930.1 MAG: heat-shock protein Hsp20 [Sulfurimonas sp. RIFOXYD2_FULL_34_21]
MLISRYFNPVESYKRRRGIDFFNDLLNSLEEERGDSPLSDFKPAVNTREGKDAYHVDVDLPGVKKEDINISVENNTLTVSGKRETKKEVKEEDYYRVESSYGKFQRSFTLPENIDTENIRAASQDGVLEVVIPKLQVIKNSAKKIEIK